MRFRTRPPVKQDAIVAHLVGQILSGALRPGARVPTRADLERTFKVSPVTVHRALERLVEDGFVTVAGPHGTFVSLHPPHLHRVALAFPVTRVSERWVRFWSMLLHEAETLSSRLPLPIPVYYGIESGAKDGEADRERLGEDLAAHRLSGIIFASDPVPSLVGTELLAADGLPRVTFSRGPARHGLLVIGLAGNGDEFFTRAVDRLVARGRKRIALLTVPGFSGTHLELYRRILAGLGLAYEQLHVQIGLQSEPHWSAHLVQLMFRSAPDQRPDALIIADDNLVDHACAGLMQLGLRVPDDVDVVAHANFPLSGNAILPVTRLGFDVPAILRTCLAVIARRHEGLEVPPLTVIPPLFTWELPQPAEAAPTLALPIGERIP